MHATHEVCFVRPVSQSPASESWLSLSCKCNKKFPGKFNATLLQEPHKYIETCLYNTHTHTPVWHMATCSICTLRHMDWAQVAQYTYLLQPHTLHWDWHIYRGGRGLWRCQVCEAKYSGSDPGCWKLCSGFVSVRFGHHYGLDEGSVLSDGATSTPRPCLCLWCKSSSSIIISCRFNQ